MDKLERPPQGCVKLHATQDSPIGMLVFALLFVTIQILVLSMEVKDNVYYHAIQM